MDILSQAKSNMPMVTDSKENSDPTNRQVVNIATEASRT